MFVSHRRTALPDDRAWLSTRAIVHHAYRVHLVDNQGIVSEDRLMLRAYDRRGAVSRPIVTVMLEGEARLEACGRAEWLGPGDVSVIEQKHLIRMRQGRHSARFRSLALEWEPGTLAPLRPEGFVVHRRLIDPRALVDASCPLPGGERAVSVVEPWLRATLTRLRDAGLTFSPDADLVEPIDESTRQLAAVLDHLLSDLRGRPMAVDLFDQLGLSLRQINRRVIDFNQRYGFNALGWRDALNRRRLMLGAALLTAPGAAVGEVSDAVGFSSPTAFSRAMAEAGFPAPSQVARLVASLAADEAQGVIA